MEPLDAVDGVGCECNISAFDPEPRAHALVQIHRRWHYHPAYRIVWLPHVPRRPDNHEGVLLV